MATTQSSAFTYNVSEGLLHAYINATTSSSRQDLVGAAGLDLSTDNGGAGVVIGSAAAGGVVVGDEVVVPVGKNKTVLGPPFRLTVWSEEHLISTSVVLGIMVLCCIIGNCFVIAAVLLERSLHNVANYLVLSLAVADLMVAVLVMPLSVVSEISRVWFLHSEVCDMWISFDVLCCTASILHLVAIALDRYWAVTSIDYIRRRSARRILLMILAVWIVALIISIPPLFGWREPDNDPDLTGKCIISQNHGYTIFSTVGAFYLPMFLMICIYCRIYVVARRRIRKKKFNEKKRKKLHGGGGGGGGDGATYVAPEEITMVVTQQPEYSMVSNCNGCSPGKERAYQQHNSHHNNSNANNGLSSPSPHFSRSPDNNTTTTTTTASTYITPDTPTGTPTTTNNKSGGGSGSGSPPDGQKNLSDASGDNDSTCGALLTTGNGKSGYTNGIEADPPTMIMDKDGAGGADGAKKPCLPSSRQRDKIEQRRERKAARTLAIITGAFLLCWLPFFIVALAGPFIREKVEIPLIVDSLLLWLGYLNSLLNPIIYTIFSPEFRTAFRKILFGKYSRRGRR